MAQDKIVIQGAREHNLKNFRIELPRDKLIVITGISGSGKSTLAFDTLYAEGQRRYVESLSSYARQFLGVMDKPDVDYIEGLSPAVSIDQKSTSHNPRSTVGTITEVYDYLRLLFARAGRPHCPNCGKPITRQTVDGIVESVMQMPEGERIQVLGPVIRGRKGEYRQIFEDIHKMGFVRVRVDGEMREVTDDIPLDRYKQHTIEVVVDRLVVKDGIQTRLAEAIETGLKLGKGVVAISQQDGPETLFSEQFACPDCGINVGELEPRSFSFNSPYGACPDCTGLGTKTEFDPELVIPDPTKSIAEGALAPFLKRDGEMTEWRFAMLAGVAKRYGFSVETPIVDLKPNQLNVLLYGVQGEVAVEFKNKWGRSRTVSAAFEGILNILQRRYDDTESEYIRGELQQFMAVRPCPKCKGRRLKDESLAVTVGGRNIAEVARMSIEASCEWFGGLTPQLTERERTIGERIVKETRLRLGFLLDVGLGYLTLDRAANTLAGGEAQRIRLATQIGSGLMGVLYILDEPSIGLHQRDNRKLIQTLTRLRDLGNTVIVVEHDEETIREADYIVDLGPGAGDHGGHVVAAGPLSKILKTKESLTGQYLTKKRQIEIPLLRRPPTKKRIRLIGARQNNLKNVTAEIPLGLFVCVTGVSGSGKSTLIQETLFPRLMYHVYGTRHAWGVHNAIEGLNDVDKVVDIDQSPIGRTPRSNPATYTGVFDTIRDLFAAVPEARARGYLPGRFSFNVRGGRCEACRGDGMIKIEMQFLPDVYVPCESCKGARYGRETLEIKFKGKTISDVLNMTVEEAVGFFAAFPAIQRKMQTLNDVGLDYIRLGQPATTLSGGEAQRVKLATELSKRGTGSTVYILDEPTTGLHFEDIRKLLGVLHRLVDAGNTVLVIEHNLDVIKTADWVIDLGPEGGDAGGQIIVAGTPEEIAAHPTSWTGQFLRSVLK